ncbi:MAG: hypothetical protein AABX17_01025 [Nanoarchaeota archaeon]
MKGVKNRGWIAVFTLIGLILAVSISSLIYVSKDAGISYGIGGYAISVDRAIDNLKFERYLCTKKLAIEGIDLYGLNESSVSGYISKNLGECVNPVIQRYMKGYDLDSGLESLNVDIGEMDIKINSNFPLLLSGDGEVEKTGNFSIVLRRHTSKELNHDENCIISEDSWLLSFDNKFQIFIPEGTEARSQDGTCLENMSLKLETPIVNLESEAPTLSSIYYVPGPNGASFNEGAILRWINSENDYTEYITDSMNGENYPRRT